MLNRKLSLFLRVITVGLFVLISFKVGVHIGAYESWLLDSSAKASLLVGELKVIRSGKAENLVEMKEIELDGAITRALKHSESGWSWLFYPFSENYEHDRYLRTAAAYRKQHSSPTLNLDFGKEREFKEYMEAYRSEVALRMTQLQNQYGISGPDTQPSIQQEQLKRAAPASETKR